MLPCAAHACSPVHSRATKLGGLLRRALANCSPGPPAASPRTHVHQVGTRTQRGRTGRCRCPFGMHIYASLSGGSKLLTPELSADPQPFECRNVGRLTPRAVPA